MLTTYFSPSTETLFIVFSQRGGGGCKKSKHFLRDDQLLPVWHLHSHSGDSFIKCCYRATITSTCRSGDRLPYVSDMVLSFRYVPNSRMTVGCVCGEVLLRVAPQSLAVNSRMTCAHTNAQWRCSSTFSAVLFVCCLDTLGAHACTHTHTRTLMHRDSGFVTWGCWCWDCGHRDIWAADTEHQRADGHFYQSHHTHARTHAHARQHGCSSNDSSITLSTPPSLTKEEKDCPLKGSQPKYVGVHVCVGGWVSWRMFDTIR